MRIGCCCLQGGLGSEDRGIKLEVACDFVSEIAQFVAAINLLFGGADADPPDHLRPFGFGCREGARHDLEDDGALLAVDSRLGQTAAVRKIVR